MPKDRNKTYGDRQSEAAKAAKAAKLSKKAPDQPATGRKPSKA